MKKIKICHITEATGGGVRTHILQLAENLDHTKYEQIFIVSLLRGRNIVNDLKAYIPEKNIVSVDMERQISPIKDIISLFKIFFLLIRFNDVDIIHCHSAKAGVLGRLANFLLFFRKKIIYTPHAFSFHNYQNKIKQTLFCTIEKLAGLITDVIIAVSPSEKEFAVKKKIISQEKVKIIENAIPQPVLPEKTSKEEFFLNLLSLDLNYNQYKIGVFVGRLTEQKNPFFILELARKMDDNVLFLLAGEGEYYNDLKYEINKYNLNHKVFLLGHVDNVSEILFYSDFMILPSLWEGLPYSILESLSVGTPVFASNIDGNNDAITQDNGFLFDVDKPNELIRKLETITFEELKNMGEIGIGTIEKKYMLDRMIKELQNLYNEQYLLSKKKVKI